MLLNPLGPKPTSFVKLLASKYRVAKFAYKNWLKEFKKKKRYYKTRNWLKSWHQADLLLRLGFLLWAIGMCILLPFAYFLAILGVAIVVFSCVLPPPKEDESDQQTGRV